MPEPDEIRVLRVVLRMLDAASTAAERSLLSAYPMIDEDPFFDPHALDDDPHDAAAEIAFVLRSLRDALRRYRRLTRPTSRAANQCGRRASSHRARPHRGRE